MCVAFASDVVSCSVKTLDMLEKSAHKNWKKAKEDKSLIKHVNITSFAQRSLMRFLNFAKMKETWM